MIALNLDTPDRVQKFVDICSKYKDKFNIDVEYGRYVVDASSIMGVSSLIGHIVKVKADNESHEDYGKFADEVMAMSGCYQ